MAGKSLRLVVFLALLAPALRAQPTTLTAWPCKAGPCQPIKNGFVIGEIRMFAFGNDSPAVIKQLAAAGWVECRGQDVLADEFKELAAVIGPLWGSADGKYTFYLPDLRGVFVRGWQHNKKPPAEFWASPYRGDSDVSKRLAPRPEVAAPGIKGSVNAVGVFQADHVGSVQKDEVGPHDHFVAYVAAITGGRGGFEFTTNPGWANQPQHRTDRAYNAAGNPVVKNNSLSSESHPPNAYVSYFIYVGQAANDIETGRVTVNGKALKEMSPGGCIRAESKSGCDLTSD